MADMVAGPELDAEIARRVFGLNVLGMAPCHYAPDGCDLEVGAWGEQDAQRPVYLVDNLCSCQEGIERVRGDQEFLGHLQWCLEPAPEYSSDDGVAFTVFKRGLELCGLAEINADMEDYGRQPEDVMTVSFYIGNDTHEWVTVTGPFPWAVCTALLSALEHRKKSA